MLFLISALAGGNGVWAGTPQDQIIVGFVADTPNAEIDAIAVRFALTQIREFKNLNARVYAVESHKTESVLKELAKEKWVDYAERDGKVSILPNPPAAEASPTE